MSEFKSAKELFESIDRKLSKGESPTDKEVRMANLLSEAAGLKGTHMIEAAKLFIKESQEK